MSFWTLRPPLIFEADALVTFFGALVGLGMVVKYTDAGALFEVLPQAPHGIERVGNQPAASDDDFGVA